MRYIYHGDKLTDATLKKQLCNPVLNDNGKCRRGRNSNMLVEFENGTQYVVLARMLRLNKAIQSS
jgi:hypothetical protein